MNPYRNILIFFGSKHIRAQTQQDGHWSFQDFHTTSQTNLLTGNSGLSFPLDANVLKMKISTPMASISIFRRGMIFNKNQHRLPFEEKNNRGKPVHTINHDLYLERNEWWNLHWIVHKCQDVESVNIKYIKYLGVCISHNEFAIGNKKIQHRKYCRSSRKKINKLRGKKS